MGELIKQLGPQTFWLIAGVAMLIGSFATMSSSSSDPFDQDLGLLLLVGAVVSIGFGLGLIDLSAFKHLIPSK